MGPEEIRRFKELLEQVEKFIELMKTKGDDAASRARKDQLWAELDALTDGISKNDLRLWQEERNPEVVIRLIKSRLHTNGDHQSSA